MTDNTEALPPPARKLSEAQRALLRSASTRLFGMVDVRGLRTAESLVKRGYMRHIGTSRILSCGATFQITDAGLALIKEQP